MLVKIGELLDGGAIRLDRAVAEHAFLGRDDFGEVAGFGYRVTVETLETLRDMSAVFERDGLSRRRTRVLEGREALRKGLWTQESDHNKPFHQPDHAH
jgi:hypothetical protein